MKRDFISAVLILLSIVLVLLAIGLTASVSARQVSAQAANGQKIVTVAEHLPSRDAGKVDVYDLSEKLAGYTVQSYQCGAPVWDSSWADFLYVCTFTVTSGAQ